MDKNINNVFSSNITRADSRFKNDLYELLTIVPAKPLLANNTLINTCDFIPKTDKFYIPKRKSRLKVKTLRDIRNSFENDTYNNLPSELETQQRRLLKIIRRGSSKDEYTQKIAKNLLLGQSPILRSTWQMLVNINPEHHTYPRQFVLWNGKHIQVNGSYGGNKKLLYNFDLAFKKAHLHDNKLEYFKESNPKRKKGLLRNSLTVKFKPGPLGRKKSLDVSHQKYHVGTTEVIHLPKLGLDIEPTYGTALESTITHYLNNMHKEDGTISRKWAELAVSVIGKIDKSVPVQLNRDCVTFDLNYNYNQKRIIMRRDVNDSCNTPTLSGTSGNMVLTNTNTDKVIVLPEIKDIMNKILDSVEISISQNDMYIIDEEKNEPITDGLNVNNTVTNLKDKTKRRFCELDRLDVTVIRIPETEERNISNSCYQKHCARGCVCASLQGSYNLRQHCGRIECMFECKCNFSKYKNLECSDVIPGLINLEDKINLNLAREEQKFHQTVIVRGEKRIFLKADKRNLKTPKRYVENDNNLRNKNKSSKTLSIVAINLNCKNIEPWCLVHKLYKCFCKGKFTESCLNVTNENDIKESISKEANTECYLDKSDCNTEKASNQAPSDNLNPLDSEGKRNINKITTRYSAKISKINISESKQLDDEVTEINSDSGSDTVNFYSYHEENEITCARVNGYEGRKFSDGYYKNTNYKISELEKNDKGLQNRLTSLSNTSYADNKIELFQNVETKCENNDTQLPGNINSDDRMNDEVEPNAKRKRRFKDTSIVAWLETNYRLYKSKVEQGLVKNILEPPKVGKIALHSWDFILSRYRERKNLFLISVDPPLRIFMAVHTRNSFFDNCININDIRFADLKKYPQTVKNLLTNATDQRDNFCILLGLPCCWEVIGSVSKINENGDDTPEINIDSCSDTTFILNNDDKNLSHDNVDQEVNNSFNLSLNDLEHNVKPVEDSGSSKWFVMTIENDFSEIRFFRKGFFVKHESIVNAINVARNTGKTVRLSSKKCIEQCEMPQFGIYAIPNANDYCVFVGPYELEDNLGIETIKTYLHLRKINKTRGFWITTNKIDNLKVVENPLLFIPSSTPDISDLLHIENHHDINKYTDINMKQEEVPDSDAQQIKKESTLSPIKNDIKIVKPIKIRKTNGFYHLDTNLKKFTLRYPRLFTKTGSVLFNPTINLVPQVKPDNINVNSIPKTPNTNDSEEISQIKISAVFSGEQIDSPSKISNREGGMFILKPEEINKRVMRNLFSEENEKSYQQIDIKQPSTSVDSQEKDFVYVISDDENDECTDIVEACKESSETTLKEVWIECTNISNLGWVAGRINSNNLLSYTFSDGKYSKFYTEEEVFSRINKEIFDRVSVLENLSIEKVHWKITESEDKVKGKQIDLENLTSDHIDLSEIIEETNGTSLD